MIGYNQFAYCFNNPVNMSDDSGNWPKWIKKAADWANKNVVQPVKKKVNEVGWGLALLFLDSYIAVVGSQLSTSSAN